jgi:membrane-bound inhibitor of C-type lysozyme
MRAILAGSFGIVLLVGHAHAREFRYACADKSSFGVTFTNRAGGADVALLTFGPKEQVALPRAPSADGGRYADNGVEFWTKGKWASLSRPGRAPTTCRTMD